MANKGDGTRRGDAVLIVWLILSALWDVAVIGCTGYLVFWRGHSGWWFVLAGMLTYTPTLFKALEKRFGIEKSDGGND